MAVVTAPITYGISRKASAAPVVSDAGPGMLRLLPKALAQEYLLTNEMGCYASSTTVGCNTRKYHGLLVAPYGDTDYVTLAAIDEVIQTRQQAWQLSVRQYRSGDDIITHPQGNKHLVRFRPLPYPMWEYRIGSLRLRKELLILKHSLGVLIRYQLLGQPNDPLPSGPVATLRLQPLVAMRSSHSINDANLKLPWRSRPVENGLDLEAPSGHASMFFRWALPVALRLDSHWNYANYYKEEEARGYAASDDLYAPGTLELELKPGQQFVLLAGIGEPPSQPAHVLWHVLERNQPELRTYEEVLDHAAGQYLFKQGKELFIRAGFPWFRAWGRDTLVALPGLLLTRGKLTDAQRVLQAVIDRMDGPLTPNMIGNQRSSYNNADGSLWLFWVLQQFERFGMSKTDIWKRYGKTMRQILTGYRDGTLFGICMHANGLLAAGEGEYAVTWMDAVALGHPVTPRHGYAVEINGLWFNAVTFAVACADEAGDVGFHVRWSNLPAKISSSFEQVFCNDQRGWLADTVDLHGHVDAHLRPNQVIAIGLPHVPVSRQTALRTLKIIQEHLLTPVGLRTLNVPAAEYYGTYEGDQLGRDRAYHQGTVWPWLLQFYAEALLRFQGKRAKAEIRRLYQGFAPQLRQAGLGQVSEIFDGNAPHTPRGCIGQAWSVAAVLWLQHLSK